MHKADLQLEGGKSPNHVAVDETAVRLDDEVYWLYAAVYSESNELLPSKLEPTRSNVLAHAFLTELRERHDVVDTVFLVDGATPLKDDCIRHDLDRRYEERRNRNIVAHVFLESRAMNYTFSTVSATSKKNF